MNISKFLISIILVVPSMVFALEDNHDWRKNATTEEKVQQMVKVIPSASNIMIQMGERYKNLYWAAKMGKWEFANYQVEEMQELIHTLQITRPKRAKTASEFLQAVFPTLPKALESKQWKEFEAGFDLLRQQCMECHVKNDHAFITLPIPKSANSPVLNMN